MTESGPLDADYFSAADESDNARGASRPTRQEMLVQIIQPPRVEHRPEKTYLGIRVVTPFRGMLRVRDELLAELYTWLASHDIEPTGPFFLRLHVIDMEGPMDLEVGVVTTTELEGDDRVRPGVLPVGGYATLTYVDHARRANKALIDWARNNGVALDCWDEPSGDAFACRYEAYITDPRTEPRKTKWEVELNMRVA
jgi:effector-binding domain-containing protein